MLKKKFFRLIKIFFDEKKKGEDAKEKKRIFSN